LAFIGQLDERAGAELADAIALLRERSGEFVLERMGYFAKPRVLWAGVGRSPSLEALAGTVRDLLSAMQVPFDAKPFAPHVTLLRHASSLPAPAPKICIPWPSSAPDLVVSERDPKGRLIYRPWSGRAPGQHFKPA
jgi:RNA 2',3'-cyclic 3'-phosphodiesterase